MDARAQAEAATALVEGLGEGAGAGFALFNAECRPVVASPSIRSVAQAPPAPLAKAIQGALRDGRHARAVGVDDPGGRTWCADVRPALDGGLVAVAAVEATQRRSATGDGRDPDVEALLDSAQAMARIGWWSWDVGAGVVRMSPQLATILGRDPSNTPDVTADQWLASVVPDERELAVAEVGRTLRDGTELDVRLRVHGGHGRPRVLHARAEPILDSAGAIVGLHGFSQDVTDEESATRQQRAVAELGRAALAGEPVDGLLERAATLVADTLLVEMSAILEVEPGGESLHLRAAWTAEPPSREPNRKTGVASQAGFCVKTRAPVVVEDWLLEDRFPRSPGLEAIGARSGVCAPIPGPDGGPFGVIGAQSRAPHHFTPDVVVFLQALARVLADAIARARAAEEIAELAAARGRLVGQALEGEERARATIAERLHDGVLQELLAAGHDLYGLDPDGRRPEVQALHERLRSVVGSLREAMTALHPTVLRHGGLEAALAAVAEQQGNACVEVDPAAARRRDELVVSLARQLLAGAGPRRDPLRLSVTPAGDGVRLELAGCDGLTAGVAERVEAVGGRVEQGPSGDVAVVIPQAP